MAIAKLSLVNIIGDMSRLDDVIIRCLDRGDFHPEKSMQSVEGIHGFVPLSDENPYLDPLGRLTNLGVAAGLNPKLMPQDKTRPGESLKRSNQYYIDFYNEFKERFDLLNERRNFLKSEIEQDNSVLVHLKHINELDVDLDDLFSCKYIRPRFGRIPLDSYQKLSLYADKPFIFIPFDVEQDYRWGLYLTLIENAPVVDDIFSSLYFERLRVPDFVHGTPEEAFEQLEHTLKENRLELGRVERKIAELVEEKKDAFYEVYTRLKFLSDSFEMRKYVSVLKRQFLDVFYITGFIEEDRAQAFAKSLQDLSGVSVELKPHDSDKRVTAPTKLKNGWFAKPFEMFVEMYGLPSYDDFDPTPFVAFTYSLLFGIMFGDLGQGLLLVIAGALLWKFKKMNIGRVINRVGIFSCIFGTLYGSVFGFEHLLDPVFRMMGLPGKPIEVMAPDMTNIILLGAVGLGVALIIISILLDVYIGFRRHDFERAFFSANGVAGLVFYGSILVGAVAIFLTGKNLFSMSYVLGLIVLPLVVILFKEPIGKLAHGVPFSEAKPHDGLGAYLTEGVFELFEVVLSFFSNTMSFLRVGGFVLSHAGMMAVVFALSEMVGSTGSPFVVVIGNLFVIGMEGLIVGIQVLRLEFYEMFSRYFDGDGKPFTPITVSPTEET
ncbi:MULTISPECIES: V-type ATP synthase subunit I [Anaerotruncus]|jgi:V/A-type H+-transporting ATPase subunit I|uniref:V-type ATP synthase subunit I n=1 Tax=Anaerotruncus TaxID=244127 RepID=UPI000E52FAB8|nr:MULTISPECIES: V-type ATPase 116kDa subunit family protein [Anaerotruncus]RGX55666.1 V-type ATP synthase subunit I [Anaerotruncus sp. AF02-27]